MSRMSRPVSADLGAFEPALLTIRKPSRVLTGQARAQIIHLPSTAPFLKTKRDVVGWLVILPSRPQPDLNEPADCLGAADLASRSLEMARMTHLAEQGERFVGVEAEVKILVGRDQCDYRGCRSELDHGALACAQLVSGRLTVAGNDLTHDEALKPVMFA